MKEGLFPSDEAVASARAFGRWEHLCFITSMAIKFYGNTQRKKR